MFPPPSALLGAHVDEALVIGILTLIGLLLIRESVKSIAVDHAAKRITPALFLTAFVVILLITIKVTMILR
jgi:hypothetical protein